MASALCAVLALCIACLPALSAASASPPVSSSSPIIQLNTTAVSSGEWVRFEWEGVAQTDREGCWIGTSPPALQDKA